MCCKSFAVATWQSSSSMFYVTTSRITRLRPVAVDVSLPGSCGRVANFNKCISMEHTRSESVNQTENGARHQEKDVCFYRDAKELEGLSSRRWEQKPNCWSSCDAELFTIHWPRARNYIQQTYILCRVLCSTGRSCQLARGGQYVFISACGNSLAKGV